MPTARLTGEDGTHSDEPPIGAAIARTWTGRRCPASIVSRSRGTPSAHCHDDGGQSPALIPRSSRRRHQSDDGGGRIRREYEPIDGLLRVGADVAGSSEEIIIDRAGTPVAKVVPLARRANRTAVGALAGQLDLSGDGDSPQTNAEISAGFGIGA